MFGCEEIKGEQRRGKKKMIRIYQIILIHSMHLSLYSSFLSLSLSPSVTNTRIVYCWMSAYGYSRSLSHFGYDMSIEKSIDVQIFRPRPTITSNQTSLFLLPHQRMCLSPLSLIYLMLLTNVLFQFKANSLFYQKEEKKWMIK